MKPYVIGKNIWQRKTAYITDRTEKRREWGVFSSLQGMLQCSKDLLLSPAFKDTRTSQQHTSWTWMWHWGTFTIKLPSVSIPRYLPHRPLDSRANASAYLLMFLLSISRTVVRVSIAEGTRTHTACPGGNGFRLHPWAFKPRAKAYPQNLWRLMKRLLWSPKQCRGHSSSKMNSTTSMSTAISIVQ